MVLKVPFSGKNRIPLTPHQATTLGGKLYLDEAAASRV